MIQNVYLAERIIAIESDERVAYKILLVHTILPIICTVRYLHAMWVNVRFV